MHTQKKLLAGLFFITSCLGISIQSYAQEAIASVDVELLIEQSRADNAFWSVIVRDSIGNILTNFNADKLVTPASNMKLLTSATILDELGPEFRYETNLYGVGKLEEGEWQGNIFVRGSGDPSISGTFYDEDRFYVFRQFYRSLDSLGIEEVDGALIGNNSYFDQKPYPKGWSWSDLSYYYAVETNALSFNNNTVDLSVYARNGIGQKPDIEWFPFDTDYVNFVNEQVITPSYSGYDESYQRVLGTNTIKLKSNLPKNYVEKESLSVLDGAQYFIDTLQKFLEQSGISIKSIYVEDQPRNWDYNRYQVLASHQSVPLKRMLKHLNKKSDNFYAEMLLKTAAAEHFETTGTTELGLRLVEDFVSNMGMNSSNLTLKDASGLAPSNLLTTKGLSLFLVNMQAHPYFKVYKHSLSVAGQDGTLKYRFKDSPIAGKLRAKTGYVSGVRALSGYLKAKTGQMLSFSVITNNYNESTSYIDQIQEEIVQRIYQTY